ncbi:MAG: hypothetical protein KGZ84_05415 [Erysipelotrichia bacterium]|jgi:hypothetical protein|nr:hypothetical protein [Erysipelotrichia bacterium]
MKSDRKRIRSHLNAYAKKHFFEILKVLLTIFILTTIIQLTFDFLIMGLESSFFNFISILLSYWLSVVGVGVFTLTLASVIRNHETIRLNKVIEVSKFYWTKIQLLAILMTLILSGVNAISGMIHPIIQSASMAFFTLAMSFAFPLLIDNPTFKPYELIEESFKMTRGHRVDMFLLQMKPLLYVFAPLMITFFLYPDVGYSTSLSALIGNSVYWIAVAISMILLLFVVGRIFVVYGYVYAYLTSDVQHPLE